MRRSGAIRRAGTRGGGAPLWTPRMLPTATVKLWAHAGAGVTNDGSGYCSALADQGPNAYSFTQVTGSSRPAISSLNGRSSLLFDGTDDSMGCTSASSEWTVLHNGTAMHTFIAVAQTGSGGKASCWMATADASVTASIGAAYLTYTSTLNRLYYGVHNNTAPLPVQSQVDSITSDNAWMLIEYTIDSSASTKWSSVLNGTTRASNTSFAAALNASAPTATLRIGRDRGTAAIKAQGHWGESLICNGVQSGATLTQIRRYFSQKYGITIA